MLREGKIGVFETISLLSISISSKVLFSGFRAVVDALGPPAWMLPLISGVLALVFFMLLVRLLNRFPGLELVAIFQKIFGRIPGGFLSLLIAANFVFGSTLATREFAEAVKVYEYPLTPPSVLIIALLLTSLIVIWFGLEVVARTAGLFSFVLLFSLVSIFVFAWPQYDLANLFPVLGHGARAILTNSLLRSSTWGEVLTLAVVLNSLQGMNNFKKSGLAAIVISMLIMSAAQLVYNLVFPYYTGAESTIPMMAMTREIEYGRFFQRFESIFLFMWSIGASLTVGIGLYTAVSIYCKVFKIADHRVLLLPLSIIVFAGSLLPHDISAVSLTYVSLSRIISLGLYFGIPLLALLAAVVFGKKGGQAGV